MKKELVKINKMKKLKEKKTASGITLIALLITIIVLLILAAVSIATLTGQNGILTQANKSKEKTEIEEEKNLISLAYNAAKIIKYDDVVTSDDMNNEFIKQQTDASASGINPIIIKFNKSNRQYKINENGEIIEVSESEKVEYVISATMTDLYKYYLLNDTSGYQLRNNGQDIISIDSKTEMKYLEEYTNANYVTENVTFVIINDIDFNPGITIENNGTITGGTPEKWIAIGNMREVEVTSEEEWNNKVSEYGKLYTSTGVSTSYKSWNKKYYYAEAKFNGKIDGQNYTLKGMYMEGEGIGLIGISDGAIVQNLKFENNYFSSEGNSGIVVAKAIEKGVNIKNVQTKNNYMLIKGDYIGGVLGLAIEGDTNLEELISNNTANFEEGTSSYGISGIAGSVSGSRCNIYNCANYTNIIASCEEGLYAEGVAGIVGDTSLENLTISNCFNNANIEGYYQGQSGIAGETNNVKTIIKNCYNNGEIGGSCYTGGIVGFEISEDLEIFNCYNTGKIYSSESGSGCMGGLLGGTRSNINMSNCYNTGEIYASESQYTSQDIGGLIGVGSGRIYNCYNSGKINIFLRAGMWSNEECAGGLMGSFGNGWTPGQMSNCYNVGQMIINYPETRTFEEVSCFGGIAGSVYDDATIENCYSDFNITINSSNSSYYIIGTNIGTVTSDDGEYNGTKILTGYQKLNSTYQSIGDKAEYVTQNIREVTNYQSQEFCNILNEWVDNNNEYSKWIYDKNKNNGLPYLEILKTTIN